jgi:hypothetical protein
MGFTLIGNLSAQTASQAGLVITRDATTLISNDGGRCSANGIDNDYGSGHSWSCSGPTPSGTVGVACCTYRIPGTDTILSVYMDGPETGGTYTYFTQIDPVAHTETLLWKVAGLNCIANYGGRFIIDPITRDVYYSYVPHVNLLGVSPWALPANTFTNLPTLVTEVYNSAGLVGTWSNGSPYDFPVCLTTNNYVVTSFGNICQRDGTILYTSEQLFHQNYTVSPVQEANSSTGLYAAINPQTNAQVTAYETDTGTIYLHMDGIFLWTPGSPVLNPLQGFSTIPPSPTVAVSYGSDNGFITCYQNTDNFVIGTVQSTDDTLVFFSMAGVTGGAMGEYKHVFDTLDAALNPVTGQIAVALCTSAPQWPAVYGNFLGPYWANFVLLGGLTPEYQIMYDPQYGTHPYPRVNSLAVNYLASGEVILTVERTDRSIERYTSTNAGSVNPAWTLVS